MDSINQQEITFLTENLHQQLDSLLNWLNQAAEQKMELHVTEDFIFKTMQKLGRESLEYFLHQSGAGAKPIDSPQTLDGVSLRYKGLFPHDYFSVFGPITFRRAGYAYPDGGYTYPLDSQLNLPEQDYSYLLQQWIQDGTAETDYREAIGRLNRIFDYNLSANVPHRLSARMSQSVDDFYAQQPAPAIETEGSHLAVGADGKGVRIVRSERENAGPPSAKPRLGKGEKSGLKKQTVVTTEFSFDPQSRDPGDVVKALMRQLTAEERKAQQHDRQPLNKHVRASFESKHQSITASLQRAIDRDPTKQKKMIALMDGDPHLEKNFRLATHNLAISDRIDAYILDIIHVSEYIWDAATALYGEKDDGRRFQWVEDKLLAVLQGHTGRVIGGLKQIITKTKPRASVKKMLQKTITYFSNHRQMMNYDQYLQKGYPIATGVVEGACGSFVKDRMEKSGMHWTVKGAQAVLNIRAVKVNNDWTDFWKYHINNQKNILYQIKNSISLN